MSCVANLKPVKLEEFCLRNDSVLPVLIASPGNSFRKSTVVLRFNRSENDVVCGHAHLDDEQLIRIGVPD